MGLTESTVDGCTCCSSSAATQREETSSVNARDGTTAATTPMADPRLPVGRKKHVAGPVNHTASTLYRDVGARHGSSGMSPKSNISPKTVKFPAELVDEAPGDSPQKALAEEPTAGSQVSVTNDSIRAGDENAKEDVVVQQDCEHTEEVNINDVNLQSKPSAETIPPEIDVVHQDKDSELDSVDVEGVTLTTTPNRNTIQIRPKDTSSPV
eukprot:TRINITY_DN12336_c0_g1_i5.p1 TRINITY_DN12336_c0_g1~~TRINITY_DN12336_c0_g1_i5.p1  ORF type:complete len:210 (-),score=23.53 TRINITY_DN12336_c0_g1_i5:110-739(-)